MADISDAYIRSLLDSLGDLNGASNELVSVLTRLNQATQAQTNTARINADIEARRAEVSKNLEEAERTVERAFRELYTASWNTVKSFTTVSSSVYSTTNAFTSASIGVDKFTELMKVFSSTVGSASQVLTLLSRSPIGRTFGALLGGMNELATQTLEVAAGFIKFKIEALSKQFEIFQNLNKAGASFGGSLQSMIKASGDAGVNLQSMSNFIQGNIENLSLFGQTFSTSSKNILRFARDVGDGSAQLLSMYGSYENLASAISDYMAIQVRAGQVDIFNLNEQRTAVEEYLRRQRELTQLTGASADVIKKQEEARLKELAYANEFIKLQPTQQANLREAFARFSQLGPQAQRYIQEFFTTMRSGGPMSPESIAFRATMGPLGDTIDSVVQSIYSNEAEFKTSTAQILREMQPAIETFARERQDLGLIAQAGFGGQLVKNITEVLAGALRLNQASKTALDYASQSAADAASIMGKADQSSRNVQLAIQNTNLNLIEIDKMIQNYSGTAGNLINATSSITAAYIQGANKIDEFTSGFVDTITSSTATFKEVSEKLTKFANNLSPSSAPAGEQSNLPPEETSKLTAGLTGLKQMIDKLIEALNQRNNRSPSTDSSNARGALGGIAVGPTTVGEAGPEAVIPLTQGAIKVDIDFTPMLATMTKHTQQNEDILEKLTNSVEIQERIYRASA